jgi:hypothetical protein
LGKQEIESKATLELCTQIRNLAPRARFAKVEYQAIWSQTSVEKGGGIPVSENSLTEDRLQYERIEFNARELKIPFQGDSFERTGRGLNDG